MATRGPGLIRAQTADMSEGLAMALECSELMYNQWKADLNTAIIIALAALFFYAYTLQIPAYFTFTYSRTNASIPSPL